MSDLIVKGAGEIKDGLYNIKDGKLFKYKANGGTVRTYQIVSADRPTGHWIETEHSTNENGFKKWIEIRCPFCGHEPVYENIDDMEFCPKCGADMRGGDTK